MTFIFVSFFAGAESPFPGLYPYGDREGPESTRAGIFFSVPECPKTGENAVRER
jgi:hypothetical protein